MEKGLRRFHLLGAVAALLLFLSSSSYAIPTEDASPPPLVLVSFDRPVPEVDFTALKKELGNFQFSHVYPSINGIALTLTTTQVRRLARLDQIRHWEYDAMATATEDSATKDSAATSFGLAKARADFGVTGNMDGQHTYSRDDAVIAILDTGIDPNHVDLDNGKIVCWYDVIGDKPTPYDDNGHGTHVASIAAGEGEGNPAFTGAAPGAALAIIKALDAAGNGTKSQILDGLQWAISNRENCGIKVITLSLSLGGSSDGTDAVSQMVETAVARGITVVVAAGNKGPASGTIVGPAAAASAITVGSMADPSQGGFLLSTFSSRGPTGDGRVKPDLVAPGRLITAAKAGTLNSYTTLTGTSMAAPFVSGVVALMLEGNPSLLPAAIKDALARTAVDWGPPGKDNEYGYGRLDAYAAIASATNSDTNLPPEAPGHLFLTGSLSHTGASTFQDIPVASDASPLAITLVMPTWGDVNFDMSLYDPSGTAVALSQRTSRQEVITYRPAVTGTYKLEVRSLSGSGPYFADISGDIAVPLVDGVAASGTSAP